MPAGYEPACPQDARACLAAAGRLRAEAQRMLELDSSDRGWLDLRDDLLDAAAVLDAAGQGYRAAKGA